MRTLASSLPSDTPCPCGQPPVRPYRECCGPLHAGGFAATAPVLMASRYCAFVLHDAAYLLRTWHPDHRPRTLSFDPGLRWAGLEILEAVDGGPFHSTGTVEFRARYVDRGQPGELRERSSFSRLDGHWVYVSIDRG